MASGRPEIMWATALRAMDTQHRTTTWLRLVCVASLWALLPTAAVDQQLRMALQLAMVTAGALLSHVHARPRTIELLGQAPGMDRVVAHLVGTRGRATVDLPGVLEGAGIVVAVLLYAGPWPVTGLSINAHIVALLAVVLFAWSVLLNVILDAGYYAPETVSVVGHERSSGPPPSLLRWLRYALPPLATTIGLLLFAPSWTPELAAIPLSLRVCLALSFLSVLLVWRCFEQMLIASAATVADAEDAVRIEAAGDLHSFAKNATSSILNAIEGPSYRRSEVRGLVRNALVQLEEVRRAWIDGTPAHTVKPLGALWDAALAVMPRSWRSRCSLADSSCELQLGTTDWQLARRLLSDLVTNALKAGADRVVVEVAPGTESGWIDLRVRDDGPGIPSGVLDDHRTSLSVLRWEISRFDGELSFAPNTAGPGTTIRVHWRSRDRAPTDAAPPPASRTG